MSKVIRHEGKPSLISLIAVKMAEGSIGMNMKIGLMGAMDQEIMQILQVLQHQESSVIAGIRFVQGSWYGHEVVVCKSGVGKVNAAVAAQLLIDRFQVRQIWFTGVAGAVHPDLAVGDIVISSSCQQHDMDVAPLGYARGVTPYQPVSDYPADPALIALAQGACERQCTDHKHLLGRILSGDQFIANPGYVETVLYHQLGGACVEMEGAALAQVCQMNEVPYIVLRSISDQADGEAEVNFAEFTVMAAERSFAIVNDMMQHAARLV